MHSQTHETVANAIQRQIEKIYFHCQNVEMDKNSAVHEIRKSFKRIKALLRFLKETDSGLVEISGKHLKTVNEFLSPLRESYVNLILFDRLKPQLSEITESALDDIRNNLQTINIQLINHEINGNNRFVRVEEISKDMAERLKKWLHHHLNHHDVMENLWLSYSKSREYFMRLSADSDAEEWHELRKKTKTLLYQIEYVLAFKPRYFKPRWEKLNLITDMLGEDHDLFVLSESIKDYIEDNSKYECDLIINKIKSLRIENKQKLVRRLKYFLKEPDESVKLSLGEIFYFQIKKPSEN